MSNDLIAALIGAFGTISAAFIASMITNRNERRNSSNRTFLTITILIIAFSVAGLIVYLFYDGTNQRIKRSLGKSKGHKQIIYEKIGLGFNLPRQWKIDDSAFRFGGGEIMLRRDNDPNTNRIVQGIQFNYMNIQDIYVNKPNDEISSHINNFKEIGADISVRDVTLSGIPAKRFYITQLIPNGERYIEMTWIRITPLVKFVVSAFSDTKGKARINFESERDIIIQSIVLDEKKISELSSKSN